MVFYKGMQDCEATLKGMGHEVLIPLLDKELPAELGGGRTLRFGDYIEQNGGVENFPPDHAIWGFKESAINDHYKKVEWSDAILVVNHEKRNIPGYVGGNTLMEMALAFYLKKPIYLLNPVSSELSHTQEIFGMKPILLSGDLNRIQ